MSELQNGAQYMDGGIDDAFVPPALKYDFIYNYMTTTDWKYLEQIPSHKQPAYQLKRIWLGLANGFLPEWHTNFIPTKLGNSIISGINRKIFSGQILYEAEDSIENVDDKRKWLIKTYMDEVNPRYESELKKLSWWAMASGASIYVAKINRNGNIYFDAVREDKYLPTFTGGELSSVRIFTSVYSSLDSKSTLQGKASAENYVLEDYRYKEKGQAYSILRVFRQSSGDINSVVDTSPKGLDYADMPEQVAKEINRKIGQRLNRPVKLPFKNGTSLGVKVLENEAHSAYFDMPGYSDSILAPALELLFEYDRSYTTMANDIAAGRGQVLVPDSQSFDLLQANLSSDVAGTDSLALLGALISQQNMINNKVVRKIPTANPENQKPEVVQFEMRIQEHLESLKGQRICILNAIGINPGAIDPTIDESGHAKTATEVIADEQNLITFVQEKRKPLVKVSDWAIGLIMEHYFGIKEQIIHTKFTNGNLSNAMLISQMAVSEFAAGIRSLDSAVAKINAGDTKTDLDKEIKILKETGGGMDFIDDESEANNWMSKQ